MLRSSRGALPAMIAVIALGAAGCAGFRNISIFTIEEEIELGRRISEEIESKVKLLNDPAIVDYVRHVGAKVASRSERRDVVYVFKVIDDIGQVNAFAVPGGFIYVFTGLLARMESEAELAAVLGHETAHVAERHSMEALTREVGFNLMVQALLGEKAAAWQELLANVTHTMAFLKFSREDEKEADEKGLVYMFGAGYDPQGMIDLLELFIELSDTEPSVIEEWLSTHPACRQRVRDVQALIRKYHLHGGKMREAEYKARMRKIMVKH